MKRLEKLKQLLNESEGFSTSNKVLKLVPYQRVEKVLKKLKHASDKDVKNLIVEYDILFNDALGVDFAQVLTKTLNQVLREGTEQIRNFWENSHFTKSEKHFKFFLDEMDKQFLRIFKNDILKFGEIDPTLKDKLNNVFNYSEISPNVKKSLAKILVEIRYDV